MAVPLRDTESEDLLDYLDVRLDFIDKSRKEETVLYIVSLVSQEVAEAAVEGKLLCAHCEARLGYLNWSGIQCSCSSRNTPTYRLHKSRVDISTV